MTKIPLYKQVEETIRSEIKKCKWKTDQQIPTEVDLCSRFNVSMITVRRALKNLEEDGFLYRIQGRGTYIADHNIRYSLSGKLMGFSEEVISQGKKPGTKILDFGVLKANEEISTKLGLFNNEKIFYLKRLRYIDDEISRIVISNIPFRLCPGIERIDFSNKSLHVVLSSRYGYEPIRSISNLEIKLADNDIGRELQISDNSPLFHYRSIFFTSNNLPVEYSIAYIKPETVNFLFEFRKS